MADQETFRLLLEALRRRFRDYASLEEWVRLELGMRLRDIVSETGLTQATFTLLNHAESDGPLYKTIEAKLLGIGNSSDDGVRYKVNRKDQWQQFEDNYFEQIDKNRPQIYILPCVRLDEPTAFVKRVKLWFDEPIKDSDRCGLEMEHLISLEPGMIEGMQAQYKSNLFGELKASRSREASGSELLQASHLSKLHYLLVKISVPIADFGEALTVEFLRWLKGYWDFESPVKCIVFIYLECEDPEKQKWVQRLAQFQVTESPRMVALEPLNLVEQSHVKSWLLRFPDVYDADREALEILSGGSRMRDVIWSIDAWLIKRKRRKAA